MINYKDLAALDKLRHESDPMADEVIAKIIDFGESKHIQTVFNALRQNNEIKKETFHELPDELQNVVWEYFKQGDTLPLFADKDQIKAGENVFQQYGPEISLLLLTMALPLCYSCRKGAKVLVMTGRTLDPSDKIDPLARRLLETAQFVVYAMSPDGLSSNGQGITSALKVRLIHASIRFYILNKRTNPAGWDMEEYGIPLNQEDMAGTLSSFSALTLHGLGLMGIQLSEADKNAYMHCWKIVGHYMGLKEELLTDNFEHGWEFGLAILKSETADSQDAKDLTKSCIDFVRGIMPIKEFTGFFETLMYYFCNSIGKETGKDIPKILGLNHRITLFRKLEIWVMDKFFRFIGREEKAFPFLQSEIGKFNLQFLTQLSSKYFEHKGIHFYIPPGLKTDWKLTED